MSGRILPGLGLKGYWTLGFDGWKDDMDVNLRLISVLVAGYVIDRVAALPVSPVQGDIYLRTGGASDNPNKIAIYDNAVWVHLTPSEGWRVYDRSADVTLIFNGALWTVAVAGISEAPVDGTIYGRKDAGWIAVPTGGGALPIGGTTGQVLTKQSATNGDANWQTPTPGGGSGLPWYFSPPTAVSLTLSNSGCGNMSLTNDADVGLNINGPGGFANGVLAHAFAMKALPTGVSWAATMRMEAAFHHSEYMGVGMCLRDSVSGRFYALGTRNYDNPHTTSSHLDTWINGSTFQTPLIAYHRSPFAAAPWRRIVYNQGAGTLTFQTSTNGKLWVTLITTSHLSFLTNPANEIGFLMGASVSQTYMQATVTHFSVT